MNVVLLLILIAQICLGVCAWLTPEALRSMAALLLTRADVIEAARAEHSRRLRYWQGELGLDRNSSDTLRFEPAQSIARRG